MSAADNSSAAKQGPLSRRSLVLIVALSALPVAIATALYVGAWRPADTANYGELVQPPRELPDLPLLSADGKPMRLAELKQRWSMVYVGSGPCAAACLKNLYLMRQIHSSFEKDLERIQEVLIALDGAKDGGLGEQRKDYPRTKIITGPAESLALLGEKFGGASAAGRIYLVDPRGFVMMRYPADPKPGGIKRDLGRLLKYSWVG